ncbi:hypothetical protein R1sor_017844 [Riccia sorocarpa]|uniref:Glycoside hydrolase family 19 catalytic domain-containing protein n=1 Tax=Riccia sorocarpa TaxID=122646 RepID=A0ABD3IC23_9MARC
MLQIMYGYNTQNKYCGWSKAKDGPYAWGLCYYQELAPSNLYCKEDYNYPCVAGVSYYSLVCELVMCDYAHKDISKIHAGSPACCLHRTVSPASSSSSSNSEMKPRAMARSLGAQKNAARLWMTKQDYKMIVTYLENPDNFAAINGGGRKTKITGKT